VFADGKAAGMLGFADEPSEPLMGHGHRSARRSTFALLGGLGVCALMLVAGLQLWAPAPSTLWVPPETVLDEDEVRKALHTFVSSLSSEESAKLYFSNASLQPEQWELCTIVQQCPVPKYGMAVGLLSPQKRTHIYNILALVLSDEAYKRILVQQLSNMLLGEMQTWAVSCAGRCAELVDADGLLPNHLLQAGKTISSSDDIDFTDSTKDECMASAYGGKHVLWVCDDEPRMTHHGNINTTNGRYYLGNVFDEPVIHARNNHFEYIEAYGTFEAGSPFGFRFSGHHFDLSFSFDGAGAVTDLPVFLGHNPLIVPRQSPPLDPDHEDYVNWRNMAGVPQFPDAVRVMLRASSFLGPGSHIPLNYFASTPSTGGLTLVGGKTMSDFGHLDLASASEEEFDALWDLIDYTLEFSRGVRSRDVERESFRRSGKACWSSGGQPGADLNERMPRTQADLVRTRSFFYVQAETDDLLYFVLVNSLFSLMLESEPSNHWHSILIPKRYLA